MSKDPLSFFLTLFPWFTVPETSPVFLRLQLQILVPSVPGKHRERELERELERERERERGGGVCPLFG